MRHTIRTAVAVSVILVLSTFVSVAHAQATRTWISGVGDDANPCSRTAPCKTIAGAISKTAVAGEIDALDPGGFGAITITKSITLDGSAALAGILVSGTNGITVQAGSSDVVIIRNFDIDGIGTGLNGISIRSAGDVRIENCKIYGFCAGRDFRQPRRRSPRREGHGHQQQRDVGHHHRCGCDQHAGGECRTCPDA